MEFVEDPVRPEQSSPETTVFLSNDKRAGRDILQRAQRLHTDVYLREGFITDTDLNEQGLYVDAYAERSTYLFAETPQRDATIRYIRPTRREGLLSLPTLEHFAVDSSTLREVAQVDRLSNLTAGQVIEVSALASVYRDSAMKHRSGDLEATKLLYARLLRQSLDDGHKLWVMNTHEQLVRHLTMLLGDDQVHRIGEPKEYLGSVTVPIALSPGSVVESALRDESRLGPMKREYLVKTLQGVSEAHVSNELVALLDAHGITHEKPSTAERLRRHQKALAYAGITAYALGRAVPVANIEGFEGNIATFAAIDVATVFPYTWGLIELATAQKPVRRLAGGAVAATSFAAPYAYFWAEGEGYPLWVNGAVAAIVGTAGLNAVRGLRKDRRIEQGLSRDKSED